MTASREDDHPVRDARDGCVVREQPAAGVRSTARASGGAGPLSFTACAGPAQDRHRGAEAPRRDQVLLARRRTCWSALLKRFFVFG